MMRHGAVDQIRTAYRPALAAGALVISLSACNFAEDRPQWRPQTGGASVTFDTARAVCRSAKDQAEFGYQNTAFDWNKEANPTPQQYDSATENAYAYSRRHQAGIVGRSAYYDCMSGYGWEVEAQQN